MASVLEIIALGLVGVIVAVFLKESKLPILSICASIIIGIIILLKVLPNITAILVDLRNISQSSGLHLDYFDLILKVLCITYIGEFAAQLCRDGGENGLAQKIDLAIKVIILVMALPLLESILSSLTGIIT